GSDERKASLAGNLRSLKPRNFWSALFELMTSRVFIERRAACWFEEPFHGLTPDFIVRDSSGAEFIAEVTTAFMEQEYARLDADSNYVANALAQIHNRIAVFVDDVVLPATRPSLKPLLSRVIDWLNCEPAEGTTLELSEDEVGLRLEITAVHRRE